MNSVRKAFCPSLLALKLTEAEISFRSKFRPLQSAFTENCLDCSEPKIGERLISTAVMKNHNISHILRRGREISTYSTHKISTNLWVRTVECLTASEVEQFGRCSLIGFIHSFVKDSWTVRSMKINCIQAREFLLLEWLVSPQCRRCGGTHWAVELFRSRRKLLANLW